MDVYNAKHLNRLYEAVRNSYRNLITYRMSNRRLIKEYAGSDYGRQAIGGHGIKGPLPHVNLIQQTAEAYQIALAYNAPRFNFTTWRQDAKPLAERFKVAVNNVAHSIRLAEEFQPVILDAFFRIGVFKLLLPSNPRVMTESDPYMDQELPYGSRVSLDNWVHDTGSSDIRAGGFMGDMYLIRMSDLESIGIFPKDFVSQLTPETADEGSGEYDKSESISKVLYDGHATNIDDMVRLCDIYLPRERLVLTLPCDRDFCIKDGAKPFIREWKGGETGPYHILTFADVPDNAMPTSIAENLFGLVALYNNLLIKAASRSLKEKDIPWYTSSAGEDMKRAIRAGDMVPIRVDSKDGMGVMKFGGADAQLMMFDMNILEIFNRSAGNLDMMLGLGPTAPTATQDAQLGQAVAGKQAMLRRRTNKFASSVGEGLAEILWHSPDIVVPGDIEPVPGLGSVDASWYPPDILERRGNFRDYTIAVEPYSMEYKSPEQRLGTMMQLMQASMPLLPFAMQMGTQFDFAGYFQKISELADSPEFASLFRSGGLPEQPPGGDASSVGANQPREYVRHNVAGGATPQGRQQQNLQAMMAMAARDGSGTG